MFFKQIKQIALCCILILAMTLSSGCDLLHVGNTENTTPPKVSAADAGEEQHRFNEFLNEVFKKDVQSDSVTLNYTLAHPENYGITNFKPTFGTYSLESMKENLVDIENNSARLDTFAYASLTEEQQITYDILKDYLDVEASDADILLYTEALGPTTGLQAQLPVLLAEYNFYTKEDIKNYLALLPCINDYYKQIITFEQEKSKAGLFMSDVTANSIIKQCSDFIRDPEKNYLIDIFNDRIDAYEGLTDEEKTSFKKENKDAVLNHIIPAYESLINALTSLKGTGKNSAGLCQFPKGKLYYEKLLSALTGSDKSIEEIAQVIDQTRLNCAKKIQSLEENDDSIDLLDVPYPMTDPKEILSYLKKAVKDDFPDLDDVNCNIKYVHKSLEDHLSPAFYLTPAIDNFKENNIYINKGGNNNLDEIFTTIAHEGYPGHLFQSVYFNQQNPHPIRSILNFGGYSEGWATYVEMYSYGLSGLDSNLAEYLKQYQIFQLCIYGSLDIAINYSGWDLEKTTSYFNNIGIDDNDVICEIYNNLVAEPGIYLQYTLGYIEFMELREKAEKQLGDKFSLKEFHTFLLDIGPCQFSIIDKYLDKWIKGQE